MIKRHKFISYIVTGVICLSVCGGVLAIWATSPGSISVSTDPRAIYSGSSETSVALMFNVYSGEQFIPEIMEVLSDKGASATFFIGGCWAEKHVDLMSEIAESGYEIGSHGYLHRDHSQMSYDGNLEEMKAAHGLLRSITGEDVKLFAPPSGAYSQNTLDAAEDMGYVTVLWSKDTIDWRDHDVDTIVNRATKDLKAGDMILMHPTEATAMALPQILDGIDAEGLKAECVSEVL